ncbi:hypothetical protein ACH5RR_036802 [Cinchona calisaya]|uniref:Uncharacterized protein n=1 Tax=Cinchona calisaya TaxID=153742 RepID=A0ABD2Y9Q5_9GENT
MIEDFKPWGRRHEGWERRGCDKKRGRDEKGKEAGIEEENRGKRKEGGEINRSRWWMRTDKKEGDRGGEKEEWRVEDRRGPGDREKGCGTKEEEGDEAGDGIEG